MDEVMLNGAGGDTPPPGAGENTVNCAVPADATSSAAIAARNSVLLICVVERLEPFQRTTEDETNPLP